MTLLDLLRARRISRTSRATGVSSTAVSRRQTSSAARQPDVREVQAQDLPAAVRTAERACSVPQTYALKQIKPVSSSPNLRPDTRRSFKPVTLIGGSANCLAGPAWCRRNGLTSRVDTLHAVSFAEGQNAICTVTDLERHDVCRARFTDVTIEPFSQKESCRS